MNVEATHQSPVHRSDILLIGLALVVLVRFWIMPLGSSLWLDEFGTFWVTNGGLGEILSRARLFPQSVPYAAVVWLARALGGSSEIVLRLPSLLVSILSTFCLYRLGRDLFDRETGLLASGIFFVLPEIQFAAADARPYAFAVLATIGAIWMLVRWLERGRLSDALAYVVFSVVTIYFQYLFATMLVVHAAYAIRRSHRTGRVRPRHLLIAGTVMALLLVPAAMIVLEIGKNRALHAFKDLPGFGDLISTLAPPGPLADLLLAFFACWNLAFVMSLRSFVPTRAEPVHGSGTGTGITRDTQLLLSLWAVIPVVLPFLVSRLTGTSVFVTRYMMCAVPAQALLLAWLVRTVRPIASQRAILLSYLLIVLVERGQLTRWKVGHRESWREAIAAVRSSNGSHPLLMAVGYAEARDLDWLRDPRHASLLRAPLDYYPTGGPAVMLPNGASREAQMYVAKLLDSTPDLEERFALIERSSKTSTSWVGWLQERYKARGYVVKRVWDGDPSAWVVERSVSDRRESN